MMRKSGYVYLMMNKNSTTIYTGVTSDLKKRIYQHKNKIVEGFTKKYNITKLVYYEIFSDIREAIIREKQIKGGSRMKKISLIQQVNPEFSDLHEEII